MTDSARHFQVTCPRCNALVEARNDQIGTLVTCSNCLEELLVEPASDSPDRISDGSSAEAIADELFSSTAAADLMGDEPPPWLDEFPEAEGEIRRDKSGEGASSASVARVPGQPYDFTATCPLCGTRLDLVSEQVGQKTRCPDCHFIFDVREPHLSARRPSKLLNRASDRATDDELQLSEAFTPSPFQRLADDLLGAAAKDLPPLPVSSGKMTPADAVQQTIRAAEAEYDERVGQQPQLPSRPFRDGLARFLIDPAAIGRWLIMSLALHIEVASIQKALAAAEGGGIEQILGIFMRIFATVFGVLGVCFVSTSMLTVTVQTSQGRKVVEGWPGLNVAEWFFESWPMLASLFLALAPGFALGQMAYAASGSMVWVALFGFGCGVLSLASVFPILLLSFMENNAPYSPPVWRSLSAARKYWVAFWIRGLALVLGGAAVMYFRVQSTSTLEKFLYGCVAMLLALTYFWLLGRLSWACGEALASDESNAPRE